MLPSIHLFHVIFAFSLLTLFCRLYRRQLLYCCPPRIAPLIVGNIDLNYLITVVVLDKVYAEEFKTMYKYHSDCSTRFTQSAF